VKKDFTRKGHFCSGSLALMPGKAHGIKQLALELGGSQAPKNTLGIKTPVEGERWEVSSPVKCRA